MYKVYGKANNAEKIWTFDTFAEAVAFCVVRSWCEVINGKLFALSMQR